MVNVNPPQLFFLSNTLLVFFLSNTLLENPECLMMTFPMIDAPARTDPLIGKAAVPNPQFNPYTYRTNKIIAAAFNSDSQVPDVTQRIRGIGECS